MKFLKASKCTEARWHLIHQLVILLASCSIRSIQCHAIAEATNETMQEVQRAEVKQADPSNLKWLLVQQSSNTGAPAAQLEVPPEAPEQQPNRQRGSPSTVLAVESKQGCGSDCGSATRLTVRPSTTAHPGQKWIENILINVEVMNLVEERRRELLASESGNKKNLSEAQEAQTGPQLAFDHEPQLASEAPTDDGEDLLESQLELIEAPTSAPDGRNQQPAAVEASGDQKLIESNNVSAVHSEMVAAAASTAAGKSIDNLPSRQVIACQKAYTQCALRKVCAPTLRTYNDECHDLISNRTNECSPKCLRAMIALKSSEAGEDLANCDCEGNEFCQLSKQRSLVCQPQVDKALEPQSVVSCSVASSICMANQLCSTALGYYYRHCQALFSLRHCSERCNNSLTILYKQPQALKLINCQCDGSEEFPCVRYRTYTEQLCLNKQSTPTAPATTNDSSSWSGGDVIGDGGPPGAGQTDAAGPFAAHFDGEEDEQQATNEDDATINLTNDPSDVPALIQGSRPGDDYGGGGGGNFGGPPSEADPSNSNNYFFNGIQQPAIDDNWIPLVSGRYFTNLHQQQRRQQQQKVKQQRKSSPRRAQKNTKQKVRSNETRRRSTRPYMFALTSSASSMVASAQPQMFGLLLSVMLLTFLS